MEHGRHHPFVFVFKIKFIRTKSRSDGTTEPQNRIMPHTPNPHNKYKNYYWIGSSSSTSSTTIKTSNILEIWPRRHWCVEWKNTNRENLVEIFSRQLEHSNFVNSQCQRFTTHFFTSSILRSTSMTTANLKKYKKTLFKLGKRLTSCAHITVWLRLRCHSHRNIHTAFDYQKRFSSNIMNDLSGEYSFHMDYGHYGLGLYG